MCELLPNGLDIANEAEVIALVAPRAIMPVNGVLDGNAAFDPAQTRRTVDEARRIFRAYGKSANLRQMVTEEHHFFGPDVVKAVIGWFDFHLKGQGDGEPAANCPAYEALPEDEVMVYPKGKRPAEVISIPEYLKIKEQRCLEKAVFDPEKISAHLKLQDVTVKTASDFSPRDGWERIGIEGSDGRLTPLLYSPAQDGKEIIIAGTFVSKLYQTSNVMLETLKKEGYGIALVDLWGGGENDLRASATNESYYSRSLIWLGKTLQSKWIEDFRMIEGFLKARLGDDIKIGAAGIGDSAVAAVLFGALRKEVTNLWLCDAPETLRYDIAHDKLHSQALIIPGIFQFGDMDVFREKAGGKVTLF
jgi:hypothetical protein